MVTGTCMVACAYLQRTRTGTATLRAGPLAVPRGTDCNPGARSHPLVDLVRKKIGERRTQESQHAHSHQITLLKSGTDVYCSAQRSLTSCPSMPGNLEISRNLFKGTLLWFFAVTVMGYSGGAK